MAATTGTWGIGVYCPDCERDLSSQRALNKHKLTERHKQAAKTPNLKAILRQEELIKTLEVQLAQAKLDLQALKIV